MIRSMQCIFSLPGGDARKILIYLTVASAMKKLSLQELQRPSVEEFKTRNRLPVIVVLDNVRSGHNTGSVFRTCDAFGVEGLYLCGITPCPPNREVLKNSSRQ
jgi:tRNA G18 (ribose-2'-O)-methylase SpoU